MSELLVELFKSAGAIVTGSHLVYTLKDAGWFHGDAYIDKDRISMHPTVLSACASEMVRKIKDAGLYKQVQVIAAPSAGAVAWGQVLAAQLHRGQDYQPLKPEDEVLSVFCEKEFNNPDNPDEFIFKFRKNFTKIIEGKKVIVAEDITNPGTSAKKVAQAVIDCGGKVIGVCVLCNRAGQQAHDYLSPWPLLAVAELEMQVYHEEECPLCEKMVPFNLALGKARTWLATERGLHWAIRQKQAGKDIKE
jgi:orotate phosphoribosyltransferase